MRSQHYAALLFIGIGFTFSGHGEEQAAYDRTADKHGFRIFMEEGGWCWFQDPRAIVHEGKLFLGSVRGSGDGEALVGVYDLDSGAAVGTATMHPRFERDDHNSPVFHIQPDGAILAVYARHGRDRFHYSRMSDPSNPLQWTEEIKHERPSPNPKDTVTYMNLHELRDEGKLYNFYRGINFNPTFVTSSDHGNTWSEPEHFVESEVKGRHRPYARYAGNGRDTVYVCTTDAHPRDFGNSIYYFEFRGGKFYKADGTFIKELAKEGPLRPSEAELVYEGSMTFEKPEGSESVPGAAWTSFIAVDGQGHPHIAYTLYLNNDDHRYRLASWDGKRWIDREIAFGGKCLYTRESSYTGLITLDPVDPRVAIISTDVDPATGEDSGGTHEIYRATINSEDDLHSIVWEALTKNSPVRNIRPMIVRDEKRRIILWNRGDFRTYTNYQLDTVGFTEAIAK
jgi:hypothetical protein